NPGGVPVGGQTRLDIPNDHLQYAITWFLIAAALAGGLFAFHLGEGPLPRRWGAFISPITGRTAGSRSPGARRSGHDRQRPLCRAGTPFCQAERRQSRLRDPELGPLDDDARRRQ